MKIKVFLSKKIFTIINNFIEFSPNFNEFCPNVFEGAADKCQTSKCFFSLKLWAAKLGKKMCVCVCVRKREERERGKKATAGE